MRKSNLILVVLNVTVVTAGAFLVHASNRSSRATQTVPATLPDEYDIVGSADVDGDGQITAQDALYVKSCIPDAGLSVPQSCHGTWQVMVNTSSMIEYQKVGHADVNGDGKVTLGDAMHVKDCIGKLPPDPCFGQLRPRISISGSVVDTNGYGVSGVTIAAAGRDGDGDPYP